MSYDLYFWREERPAYLSPDEAIDRLDKEQPVDGFALFVNNAVVAVFQQEFPDIRLESHQLVWEGVDSGFEVHFTHSDERHIHMITATCGYGLLDHTEILNRIIDVAHLFGCGCYDPQVRKRYPEPDRL
ncbi:MAG: hypothetical protein EOP84_34530 [Verrucomicrobiaceae bacterium]|nr:MAG: hypothetical protein EOP84_34530 [Verrucomicrobiaceae bacterium]